ncbi:nucleotidyl transferase AbiEii/AbiGii toxin family protein [Enterobacter hormaechei]|uniref:nucleotidyl transferase AbiEii/AbiGii toxin family protein n=1 Tax=Enterobacter hormaechei TaxID=158836 RepID=UPI0018C20B3A|nr:nucleotidyl transferase AbiEii/AbiGii toxin family protein [Enterobacter hormaechei]MBG0709921.1 nucleotidyl transferase AbiEii/AbiGii toxin family protein [Enterobacter hormaechei]
MSSIFELYKTEEGRGQLQEIFSYAAQKHPLSLGASFLEKDLWVTEILRLLFDEGFLHPYTVAFKGGTSLSKCWNVIERFSEDIDLSIHWAELAGHSEEQEQEAWKASTRSRSQNQRFREQQQIRLEEWTAELVEKLNQRFQSYGISGLEARLEAESRGEKVDIFFPRVHADSAAYQRDHILLEFGGRNRGKPTDTITVSSYLSGIKELGELELPSATVQAYNPGYILWEKITALHQFCTQEKELNAERLSRHWYDVDCLLQHQFADLYDTKEAMHHVVEMKQQRWTFPGVDYTLVAKGELRLVPEDAGRLAAIAEDHRIAIEGGMFFKEPDGFDKIIERLQQVQDEFNCAMKKDNGI